MKKYILAILLLSLDVLFLRALSVKDIPNVQLQNSTRHLSNPDNIVSPQTMIRIDTLLSGIRARTSAEVSAVIVQSLDGEDPDDFATELFETWGIGKKDKDNGLLLLVSIDDRAAVVRTGYGLEGAIPDIVAGRIVRDSLYPKMRNGDYDAGMESTLRGFVRVLDNPGTAAEIKSSIKEGQQRENEESLADLLYGVVCWSAAITVILLLIFIIMRVQSSKKDIIGQYNDATTLTTASLIMTFIGLGLPVIIYFLAKSWRDKIRNTPPVSSAGTPMTPVLPPYAERYLTPQEITENRIHSMDNRVWVDDDTGEIKTIPFHGDKYNSYNVCDKCGARAEKYTGTRIVREPTHFRQGEQVEEHVCMHCGNRKIKSTLLPRLAAATAAGFAGGRGFGGGGGFSGGSFGGGHTGGGGFSGKW